MTASYDHMPTTSHVMRESRASGTIYKANSTGARGWAWVQDTHVLLTVMPGDGVGHQAHAPVIARPGDGSGCRAQFALATREIWSTKIITNWKIQRRSVGRGHVRDSSGGGEWPGSH